MQLNYQKSLDKLNSTVITIEKLIDPVENHSFEDRQILSIFDTVLDDIKTAITNIEYFNREAIMGTLEVLPNGRFCLEKHELTCGRSIELYSSESEEWIMGRIEYQDTYYFFGNDLECRSLHSGMKARIRL